MKRLLCITLSLIFLFTQTATMARAEFSGNGVYLGDSLYGGSSGLTDDLVREGCDDCAKDPQLAVTPTTPPAPPAEQANNPANITELTPGNGLPGTEDLWHGKGTSLMLGHDNNKQINHALIQNSDGNTYELTIGQDGKATLDVTKTDKDTHLTTHNTYNGTITTFNKNVKDKDGTKHKKGDVVFSSDGLNLILSKKSRNELNVTIGNETTTLNIAGSKGNKKPDKDDVVRQETSKTQTTDEKTGKTTSSTTIIKDYNVKGTLLGTTKIERNYRYDDAGNLTSSETKTTFGNGHTETVTRTLIDGSRTFWDDGTTIKHEEWEETATNRKSIIKTDYDESGVAAKSTEENFRGADKNELYYTIETTWDKDDHNKEHIEIWNGPNDKDRLTLIDRTVTSRDNQGRDFSYEETSTEQLVDKDGNIIPRGDSRNSIHTNVIAAYYDAADRLIISVGNQQWGQDGSSINGLDKAWENGKATFTNYYFYDSQTGRLAELHTLADGTAQNYQLDRLKNPGKRGNSFIHDYTQSDMKYDDQDRLVSYKYTDKGYKRVIGRYGVPYAIRATETGTYQINKFDENDRPTEVSYRFKTGDEFFTMGRGTFADIKYDNNGLMVSSMHDSKQIDRYKGGKGTIVDVTTKDHINAIYKYGADGRLLKDVFVTEQKHNKKGELVFDKKGKPVMVEVFKTNSYERGLGSWDKPKVAIKVHKAKQGGFLGSFFGKLLVNIVFRTIDYFVHGLGYLLQRSLLPDSFYFKQPL